MPTLPATFSFDSQDYWITRFTTEPSFEWLCPYSTLRPHLLPYLSESTEILNLGCGNSQLPFDLWRDGYRRVTSVDFAPNVVERMRAEAVDTYPGLQFEVMDCMDLAQLPTGMFEVVVDKSTVDAIACGDDDGMEKMRRVCSEVARVTKEEAVWVSVSYANWRRFEFAGEAEIWGWKTETVAKLNIEEAGVKDGVYIPEVFHYVYVNRKVRVQ
ncbi:S-adenosyl-L-methionine-dependent methyltransferase [Endogone sp. FLAS-F59071]|nr:S-adenosyl-L-methionine-dependent methyltransferase [Endogone sp. FLAS-F59071]|eukprot:RUS15533.1 S-adenosyl-L-methionine-dependent methyltransferase [Endogone sp. FLAS-F59071]